MNFDEKTCWACGMAVGVLSVLLGVLQLLACFGIAFGTGLVQTLVLGVSGIALLLFAARGKDQRARSLPLLAAALLLLGQFFAPFGFLAWPCFAFTRRAQDANTPAATFGVAVMALGVLRCIAYFVPFSFLAAMLTAAGGIALFFYCFSHCRDNA